jgi:hypothetical protein
MSKPPLYANTTFSSLFYLFSSPHSLNYGINVVSTIINYVTLLVILRFPFDSISFGGQGD